MRFTFQGYERANGEVGIRNYVLLLSMVHCSNTVTQQIAWQTGAHAITHDFGCVEFADKHTRTHLALLSAALNPNVYAVVLVGLGCEQTDHNTLMQEISAAGKPVSYVEIQEEGGSKEAVTRGVSRGAGTQAVPNFQTGFGCAVRWLRLDDRAVRKQHDWRHDGSDDGSRRLCHYQRGVRIPRQ